MSVGGLSSSRSADLHETPRKEDKKEGYLEGLLLEFNLVLETGDRHLTNILYFFSPPTFVGPWIKTCSSLCVFLYTAFIFLMLLQNQIKNKTNKHTSPPYASRERESEADRLYPDLQISTERYLCACSCIYRETSATAIRKSDALRISLCNTISLPL